MVRVGARVGLRVGGRVGARVRAVVEVAVATGGSPQPLDVAGAARLRHLDVDGGVPCARVELVAWLVSGLGEGQG